MAKGEINSLREKIRELEEKLKKYESGNISIPSAKTVRIPPEFEEVFKKAEEIVGRYFSTLKMEPSRGTIEIGGHRYVLIRASALSYDFLNTITMLYADRGEKEAMLIGKNFLFDIAHLIGIHDARSFHQQMKLTDPITRLSAGPVHFAYSGWAFVDIDPSSHPSPDDNFYMLYSHPFSFEADSWMRAGKKSDVPVCIMNSGYSSGWCEESFGIPLTSVEISCKARGDKHCTFIMAPPHRIREHIEKFISDSPGAGRKKTVYDIPTFFERKKVEEEMKLARQKAEESDKAKSDFLANMSHEIRTPLNSIIGYVDLVLSDPIKDQHREYLEIVKKSGKHLLDLIGDILDLSKIKAGQLVMEMQMTSLKEIFEKVVTNGLGLAATKKLKIHFESSIGDNVPVKISTDPLRLQQILDNLVSNAVKFTKKGTIKIGVKKTDGFLEFSVTDTGIGIPKEYQKSIFEKFRQAETGTTREYGGTGLGLTITKNLVELLGGSISVKSKTGAGSVFSFTLPLKAEDEASGNRVRAKGSGTGNRGDVVLLVEDNLINQRLTRIILEKSGYTVLCASNGKEAIQIYKKRKDIEVIVMDIQMPVLDGLSATLKIRELEEEEKRERTPVIALTAHALKEDMDRCMKAGCDGYLTKPVIMETLIDAIRKVRREK